MIRSVISMHGGREHCILIGITPADVEHLAKGEGLRYTPEDMATAGMPPDYPIGVAFVYGEDHEEIIASVTAVVAQFGKEVNVVHERPPGAPTTD